MVETCEAVTQLLVLLPSLFLEHLSDATTTNDQTVLLIEAADLGHDVVYDQFVKTDKESWSKIIMQEVNISKTEDLVTLQIIPRACSIQVETTRNLLDDISEQTTHKGGIILVDCFEFRDVGVIRQIKPISIILFINKSSCLFFDCEFNNLREFLSPDLLTWYVQKVLDVLNRSL